MYIYTISLYTIYSIGLLHIKLLLYLHKQSAVSSSSISGRYSANPSSNDGIIISLSLYIYIYIYREMSHIYIYIYMSVICYIILYYILHYSMIYYVMLHYVTLCFINSIARPPTATTTTTTSRTSP